MATRRFNLQLPLSMDWGLPGVLSWFDRSASLQASICRPFALLRAGSKGRRYAQTRTSPYLAIS